MQVKFLDQAKEDLIEIGDHYKAVGGPALARSMIARIKTPTILLGNQPFLAQEYELAPGIRRLVVAKGKYLVYYRVRASVEIIHVRRAERQPVSADELSGFPP